MFAPPLIPALAEKSLPGAAAHALSMRTVMTKQSAHANDEALFREAIGFAELASSTMAYAVSLVWWAHDDKPSRQEMVTTARAVLLATAEQSAADRAQLSGYEIFAQRLIKAALAWEIAATVEEITATVSHIPEIDRLTAHYADTAVRTLLVTGKQFYGHPDTSSERMRDEMTKIAYAA